MELWAEHFNYKGQYLISNLGRIKSLTRPGAYKERILCYKKYKGYYSVTLCKNGITKMYLVHRLVWEAFNGPIPPGMQVNHKNEDKLDNRLENLEVVTPKENSNYGTRNKRISDFMKISLIGNTRRRKPITLINVQTAGRFTFASSYEASMFFNYKRPQYVGGLTHSARKKNSNKIRLKGEDYYFIIG